MPSLDPLLPHLYSGYTDKWSDERWEILRALAAECSVGGQAEPAVSAVLCAVGGSTGHDLANTILKISGLDANSNAAMIEPSEYAARRGGRSPDVGVYDAESNQLLLAGECKRDAHISGGLRYCPLDLAGYSNQVICYPHGCWASHGALDDTSFLWLHRSGPSPWRDGVHDSPSWLEYAGGDPDLLRHWIDSQGTAISRWRTATWEELTAQLRDPHDEAADVIATIIDTWIGR